MLPRDGRAVRSHEVLAVAVESLSVVLAPGSQAASLV